MPLTSDTVKPERKTPWILVGMVLALSFAFFLAYFYFLFTDGFRRNDFFVFWAAARYLQSGTLAGAYDPGTFHAFQLSLDPQDHGGLPFVYPPHAALLFMPLGHLPLHAAMVVWDLLSLSIFLAGIRQAVKSRAPAILAAPFAALIAPSTVSNLMYGQTGLLTGGLTVLGFALLQRSPILAGTMFGLLSIKPQLAVLPLLAVLLSGHRRAIVAAAATVLLLVLASLVVFQASDWSAWAQSLAGFSTAFSTSPLHYQYGVTVYFTLLNLGAGRYAALALQGMVSVLALGMVVRIMRRDQGPLAVMAALVGVLLATPYALIYDLPMVSAVCLMIMRQGTHSGFRDGELLVTAAAWCLPLVLIASGGGNPALACLVLLGLFALILRRAHPGQPPLPASA